MARAFKGSMVLAHVAVLAAGACPLTAPCNCDPVKGFHAFNRTCVDTGHFESACEAALNSAGINVTALQLVATRVASDEVCEHSRAAAASCVTIPMAKANASDAETLSFCTGEVFDADGVFFVSVVLIALVMALILLCLCSFGMKAHVCRLRIVI